MPRTYFLYIVFLCILGCSSLSAAQSYSGTLPVVYVQTLDGQDIVSKEEYKSAVFYIESAQSGLSGFRSAADPDTCLVKGRGNYTWRDFEKKPYRIKLSSKSSLLGMTKSKHWALIAAADDNLGFLKNPVGFMLSRHMSLAWTPSEQPVELVLNGSYHGLYFLTEVIKVEKNRVAVTEQEDGETDATAVTGGWLVELDNYEEPNRVDIVEKTDEQGREVIIHFTPKSPENLSSVQRNYLLGQLTAMNTAVYGGQDLSRFFDLRDAARFYLVQELMVDCESYHGSCYLHKDRDGVGDGRWHFGPVWDFGNAFNRCRWGDPNHFIYENPEFTQAWIGAINESAAFHAVLMEEWYTFYHSVYPNLQSEIEAYAARIRRAAASDRLRWQGHGSVCVYTEQEISRCCDQLWRWLSAHVEWLYSQWGEGSAPSATVAPSVSSVSDKVLWHDRILIRQGADYYTPDGRLFKR